MKKKKWTHVALTFDGKSPSVHFDGKKQQGVTVSFWIQFENSLEKKRPKKKSRGA